SDQLQTARLVILPAALLGRAVPHRVGNRQASRVSRSRIASDAATAGGLQTNRNRRATIGESERLDSLFRKGDARNERYAAMGRLLLVLHQILRSGERPALRR